MNSWSAQGRTFICLPVVLTETDGREEEVRNQMCPKRAQGWFECLIHFSVARQLPLSLEPEGMFPTGKFACMLIDLFDLPWPRLSAGATFFGPWCIDMSGSISAIGFLEMGALLILGSMMDTHYPETKAASLHIPLAWMAVAIETKL